jgi:hypothetical protein
MSVTPLDALVNPEGTIDFSEFNHYFIPWLIQLERKFRRIGATDVLNADYYCFSKPTLLTVNNCCCCCNNERAHDLSCVNKLCVHHLHEYTTQQILFEKVLEVVVASLPRTYYKASIFSIYSSIHLDGRQKAIAIVDRFRKLYGTVAPHNIEPVVEEIDRIPPAIDISSAQYLVGALSFWNCCLEHIHPSAALSDETLISKLKDKLQAANMFAYAVLMISCPGTKFSDAVTQILSTISLYQRRVQQKGIDDVTIKATLGSGSNTAGRSSGDSSNIALLPFSPSRQEVDSPTVMIGDKDMACFHSPKSITVVENNTRRTIFPFDLDISLDDDWQEEYLDVDGQSPVVIRDCLLPPKTKTTIKKKILFKVDERRLAVEEDAFPW